MMVLLDQTCRFSDLRRKVDGVSEKMLAQTLQWLAADGFVIRTAYDEVPPHVDYRLTPLGEEVARQVTSLADWIEINLSRILSGLDSRTRVRAPERARYAAATRPVWPPPTMIAS